MNQNEELKKFGKQKREYNGTYGRMLSLAAHALAEVNVFFSNQSYPSFMRNIVSLLQFLICVVFEF